MITVYVVMNEGQLGGGGGGGYDWFPKADDAKQNYEHTLKHAPKGTYVWHFATQVPNESPEKINQFIEDNAEQLQTDNKPVRV